MNGMKGKTSATFLALATLLTSAMLTPAVSFADPAGVDSSRPTTFIKDSVITTKIKAKLAAEHLASATQLKVDTDNAGVVWLSGTAPSQTEADKAVAIARGTDGVSSVKSEIIIKP